MLISHRTLWYNHLQCQLKRGAHDGVCPRSHIWGDVLISAVYGLRVLQVLTGIEVVTYVDPGEALSGWR